MEVLDRLRTPAASLDHVCKRFLPTVAARIWETCCWPERMADGWKIGDHRFVVFSIEPDPRTELYVQLWSEPHESTLIEVCSGEWAPPAVKYVQRPQRRLLRALGFRKGGAAGNFAREVEIQNVPDAEETGREVLRILYEGFGYRGQWPLQIRLERGERAELRPVFSSVTPDDVVKLLAEHGYATAIPETTTAPVILVRRARRHFIARLEGRLPKQNEYAAMVLDAILEPPRGMTDAQCGALGTHVPGLTCSRGEGRDVRISMVILLAGGVTDEWILRAFDYWWRGVRRCERLLRTGTPRQPLHNPSVSVH